MSILYRNGKKMTVLFCHQVPSVEEAEAAQVARAAEALDDGLDALLEWGRFQRRERLDVKKPGPLYATNNYAFNKQTVLSIMQ